MLSALRTLSTRIVLVPSSVESFTRASMNMRDCSMADGDQLVCYDDKMSL